MCGISAIINGVQILDTIQTTNNIEINNSSNNNNGNIIDNNNKFIKDIKERLLNRGPDSIEEKIKIIKSKAKNEEITIELKLISSVLGLRGPLTVQPLEDDKGNILLWNGEMFGGYDIGIHDNDTCLLSHILSELSTSNPRDFIDIIIKIKGPFAFLYWQEKERMLWFGRDVLGRRSLLVNRNDDQMIISSMGSFPDGIDDANLQSLPKWEEINTFGLFSIHFPEQLESKHIKLETHSWDLNNIVNIGITSLDYDNDNDDDEGDNSNNNNNNDNSNQEKSNLNENIDQLHFYPFGRRVKMSVPEYRDEEFQGYVDGFYRAISNSIYTRVCNLPNISNEIPDLIRPPFLQDKLPKPLVSRLGILFSGGLDSMVLAAMSDKHIPLEEPIHLINVAFGEDNSSADEFDRVPDRKAAIQGLKELQIVSPTRQWKLIKVNVTTQEMEWAKKHVYQLSYPAITIMDMTICLALWFAGRGEGIIHDCDEKDLRFMTTSKPRFPYLDEDLIKYLNDIPLCYVCDLSQPQGTGDKRILREVGPIQFGSRSSKQLNKNIPARITQKCGKEVFSFTTPLYDPSQDPAYDAIQKLKLKQQKNIEKKKQIQLKKEIDSKNLKEKQLKQQEQNK
ncbi:hypothetical protein DICPUDRAFT_55929 [Dictyostelium purpureum]|uniref:Glutamine amidotransferase type-2 domain-containing protein n=1 Tax=Dictyostelium purpureum TaxID=5786 RepID=F0ZP49_DICPU|nr:uncharacterized protein DICPUDRAFT_55929 [Dictyostelium purpureum]EGC34264.1 hypothetical protein DICPUDRAFT_55929 [Dictyostelium purpureum]|eukprot:XP_003289193.1 hypothetical protein DICPUDRAFT_55929 [Dictyostelium purpureum]